MAAGISRPDETLHFPNSMSIEISYRNTQTYSKCKSYDPKAMVQGYVWHQIVVQHNGKVGGLAATREILDAVFDVVAGEELFPIAYRHGAREDRFLVRQCQPALDKIFAENLRIQLSTGVFLPLQMQLNVGDYKFGQLSPTTKIAEVLVSLYDSMECVNGEDGILNLSRFGSSKEFYDVVINLGNRAVFECVCNAIYRNDEKFRTVNGMILSQNGLTTLAPLAIFRGVDFALLDLHDNELRSATRLCRDLKDIKADELLLAGNPLTKLSNYPECLKPILKNFKRIDNIPSENLTKEYTPMDNEVDVDCDGYRIDWSNKADLEKFQSSDDWHAIMIPDPEMEFSKEEIFDYFFITVSPTLSDIYPSYYNFSMGEHQFLVRQCFDQIQHLVENCNLEITIPRLGEPNAENVSGTDSKPQVHLDKTLVYYMRMAISPFKHGQVEPLECMEKALTRRFNAMDRLLDLENFQNIEGLENIIINMSSPKILGQVLTQASRKFLSSCVELHLGHNKILHANYPNVLAIMGNLKAIDLGNNWIHELDDIKELQTLGLKSLRLDGNPLCAKYGFAGEYIKAVRKIFPDLTKLDNIEITSKGNLSVQKNFLCDVKGYDFVEQFVSRYFQTFQSSERLELKDLYHPKAIFTMTSNYVAAKLTSQNFKRISKYVSPGRNILKMSEFSRAFNSIHVGPNDIMQVFMALPNVSHDMLTFSTDTPIFNDNMVVIHVNGIYLDQGPTILDTDILMSFTRTFVLTPVERNLGALKCAVSYQIVNDQLNVFNPSAAQTKSAFKYFKSETKNEKEVITVPDKEAMLVMFQEVTGLKSIWCTRCLDDAKWNFQSALEGFMSLAQRKEVPDTAFI